jgi:hypothetical protein
VTAPVASDPTLFTDSLVVTLAFPGLLGDASVPGANVKQLALELRPWGFSGEVTFWMPAADDDGKAVHGRVMDQDLLEFELTLAKRHYLEDTPSPVSIKGVVTARSFTEIAAMDVVGQPVLFRRYTLALADAAAALWSQHRPTDVYARVALEAVIGEHTPSQVPLKIGWAALKAKRPVICLALGEDEASFYDFVCWFTALEQGHFTYDYGKRMFRFTDKKASALIATALEIDVCAEARVHIPEPPRVAVNVLNSHASGTAKTAVANKQAVTDLEHDVHLHTPLAQATKDREALEKKRLKPGKPELEMRCKAWPEVYLAPGVSVKLDGEAWSPHLYHAGKTLRTVAVSIAATATEDAPEHDLGLPFSDYQIRLGYRFECDEDPRTRLPAHRWPRYPLRAEGKVLSTLGDDGDRAYMVYEDEQTSRDHYKVVLPVWNATLGRCGTRRWTCRSCRGSSPGTCTSRRTRRRG